LHAQRCVLFFAPFEIPRQRAASIAESEMFSIYGTAMQSTQREHDRAARGCPSIPNIDLGSWSRLATELDR
jgi:hypothetical protein